MNGNRALATTFQEQLARAMRPDPPKAISEATMARLIQTLIDNPAWARRLATVLDRARSTER